MVRLCIIRAVEIIPIELRNIEAVACKINQDIVNYKTKELYRYIKK